MLVLVDPRDPEYFRWQQSLVLLLTAGTILLLASPRRNLLRSLMELSPLVMLGRWCYAIYLWHWPIIWLLYQRGPQLQGMPKFLVVLTTTLLLAGITYRFLEQRLLQKRGRYAC